MNPIRSLLLLIASTMVASGCADSPTGSSDRSAMLVGRWTTTVVHVTSRVDSTITLLTFPDIITFHDGGSYTVRGRFDSTDIPGTPGAWRFISNGQQLVMDPGKAYQGVWTIVALTATDLRMTGRLNANGIIANVDYSAVRD